MNIRERARRTLNDTITEVDGFVRIYGRDTAREGNTEVVTTVGKLREVSAYLTGVSDELRKPLAVPEAVPATVEIPAEPAPTAPPVEVPKPTSKPAKKPSKRRPAVGSRYNPPKTSKGTKASSGNDLDDLGDLDGS